MDVARQGKKVERWTMTDDTDISLDDESAFRERVAKIYESTARMCERFADAVPSCAWQFRDHAKASRTAAASIRQAVASK